MKVGVDVLDSPSLEVSPYRGLYGRKARLKTKQKMKMTLHSQFCSNYKFKTKTNQKTTTKLHGEDFESNDTSVTMLQ